MSGVKLDEAERETRAARADGDVLLAVDGERDGVAVDRRAEVHFPEHLAACAGRRRGSGR